MCYHFFGNIFNLKSGIFIFPNKCIYHASYHQMKRDFFKEHFCCQNRAGDAFVFFFSSKYFVTTYLKAQYFSKKFNFELKLFWGFQREDKTKIWPNGYCQDTLLLQDQIGRAYIFLLKYLSSLFPIIFDREIPHPPCIASSFINEIVWGLFFVLSKD